MLNHPIQTELEPGPMIVNPNIYPASENLNYSLSENECNSHFSRNQDELKIFEKVRLLLQGENKLKFIFVVVPTSFVMTF